MRVGYNEEQAWYGQQHVQTSQGSTKNQVKKKK